MCKGPEKDLCGWGKGKRGERRGQIQGKPCGGLLLREELDFYLKSEKEPLKG